MRAWRMGRTLATSAMLLPLLSFSGSSQLSSPLGLPQEGPDVPAVTAPVVLAPFVDETVSFTQAVRTRLVDVPVGDWDRIILEFTERPDGDPWDRIFGVALDGVEVLRGTTPRTAFTVRKDITAFAALLPPGGSVPVSILVEAWAGTQRATLKIEFYENEPTKHAVEAPWDHAVGAHRWRGVCGAPVSVPVTFPADAPSRAFVEITLSGHGSQEFQWSQFFHILVDGEEVAQAMTLPYTYAFLGFSGSFGGLVHPFLWWTAQRALDLAGVHAGVGEIPAYRAEVEAADLGWLAGTHTVTIVPEFVDGCTWVTSLTFLLND